MASGACAQHNIRLSALCVDLFVVRSSCHVMATSFAWPSVLVKRGNTVIKSRTVVKCTWKQIFGGLLQHLGVCFNNFNFFFAWSVLEKLLSKKHVINLVWP